MNIIRLYVCIYIINKEFLDVGFTSLFVIKDMNENEILSFKQTKYWLIYK
jgi:hypothetical protein